MQTKPKRRRGRPRQLDLEKAARAAMDLFHEHGYEGISTAALSEALGVAPPSLYAAFGSKAGLYAAAVDAYQEMTAPCFREALAASTVTELAAGVLAAAARVYSADPARPGCLVLDGTRGSTDEAAIDVAQKHKSAFRSAIVSRLDALGDAFADKRADMIVTAMMGLSAAARAGEACENLLSAASAFAEGIARA